MEKERTSITFTNGSTIWKKYIIKLLSVGFKRKRFKYSKLAATARICGEELKGKKRRHSHSATKKRQKIIGDGGLWQSTALPHESNCDSKFRCTKSFLFLLIYFFVCIQKVSHSNPRSPLDPNGCMWIFWKGKNCRHFRLLLHLSFLGRFFFQVERDGGNRYFSPLQFHFIREHKNLV